MSRPVTPRDLADAGYRIELGGVPVDELTGRYWWTWAEGSGLDTSDGDWATPEEAIADARADMGPTEPATEHDTEHDDTPSLEDGRDNCNDAGTGEGRYHGRM